MCACFCLLFCLSVCECGIENMVIAIEFCFGGSMRIPVICQHRVFCCLKLSITLCANESHSVFNQNIIILKHYLYLTKETVPNTYFLFLFLLNSVVLNENEFCYCRARLASAGKQMDRLNVACECLPFFPLHFATSCPSLNVNANLASFLLFMYLIGGEVAALLRKSRKGMKIANLAAADQMNARSSNSNNVEICYLRMCKHATQTFLQQL